jgi:hypothetical protein
MNLPAGPSTEPEPQPGQRRRLLAGLLAQFRLLDAAPAGQRSTLGWGWAISFGGRVQRWQPADPDSPIVPPYDRARS